MRDEATFRVKAGLAEMLKGGVILDVVDAEQAKIAEEAGAASVLALERVPADLLRDGGVARLIWGISGDQPEELENARSPRR